MKSKRIDVWGYEVSIPGDFVLSMEAVDRSLLPQDACDEDRFREVDGYFSHCFSVIRGLHSELSHYNAKPVSILLRSDGRKFYQILSIVPAYAWASQIVQDEVQDWCFERYAGAKKIFDIDLDFLFICDDKEIDMEFLQKEGFWLRYGDDSI